VVSIDVNHNHRLRPALQPAEEVAGNLHPAIFAAQQVLPVCRFRALADAGWPTLVRRCCGQGGSRESGIFNCSCCPAERARRAAAPRC
jgi:hypothetical protein